MSLIELKANDIVQDIAKKKTVPDSVAFDPLLIFAIIGIIADVVKLVQACTAGNTTKAVDQMKNPGIFAKMRLKLSLALQLARHPTLKQYKAPIQDGILSVAASLTEDDVKTMFQEVAVK